MSTDEMCGDYPAPCNCDDPETHDGAVTAADRPSATDRALAEAWAEGHRTGWEHCQDGNYGNDWWDDPTPNPYAAAGRAETTTEEWPRCKASRDGGCDRCHDEHGRHIHCRAETTTATTEDTARAIHRALAPRWMSVAQALGPGQDAYEAMLADIAQALADDGLLATARTRPTRKQIDRAVGEVLSNAANHPDPVAVLGRSIAPLRTKITDAVLALLGGEENGG